MTASRRVRRRARLFVIAGVNGAGKSSVLAAAIEAAGGRYFNPDEATQQILRHNPEASLAEANAAAWLEGKRLVERAIAEALVFAFETTLGGQTMTSLLHRALDAGHEVHMRYVGLDGPDLHIARVRARVAAGGHDIPETKIRERYDQSRRHLVELVPVLTSLEVFDNTHEAPPREGMQPMPILLLRTTHGEVDYIAQLGSIPEWAKPVVMAALRLRAPEVTRSHKGRKRR